MKNQLPNYFYYTRAERRGAIVLVVLLLLLFFLPAVFPFLISEKETDFSEFADAVAQLQQPQDAPRAASLRVFDPNTADQETLRALGLPESAVKAIVNYRSKGGQFRKKEDLKKIYTLPEEDYLRIESYIQISGEETPLVAERSERSEAAPEYFPFDPNTASRDDLLKLGLSEKVVQTMLNFRGKGGSFRKKEDLQKIYGLTTTDYQKLEAYIDINPGSPTKNKDEVALAQMIPEEIPTTYEAYVPPIIDINRADSEEWQQLRGIGPAYAKRITNFRDKLGGFHSIGQIAETYGLPDSTFQSIRPALRLSPLLRSIPINKATAEALKDHPYLNWKQANAIVNYRQQHGRFSDIEAVKQIFLLDEETIRKIEPYLNFE